MRFISKNTSARRRSLARAAVASAALCWASSAFAQVGPLSKGQDWFIDNGFQIAGIIANPASGNPFHLSTYQSMNYTTQTWEWATDASQLTMSWGRWVSDASNLPPVGSESSHMGTLKHLNLGSPAGDEPNLNDPTVRDQQVAFFDYAHAQPQFNNVLLWSNNYGGQVNNASLDDFVNRAHPDMISFDSYPYAPSAQPWGGSPTNWYGSMRQFREFAKNTNTPLGVYRQTYASPGGAPPTRAVSSSELNLQTFAAIAFNAKFLHDFTYNFNGNSMFVGNGTGDNTINALGIAAQGINQRVRNIGPTMVRLKPINDWSGDGHTTSIMFVRGQHLDAGNTVYNDFPGYIGFQIDGASQAYTDWNFASNDPYLSGFTTVTNLGTKNDGLRGDMMISWFKPIDEWFDGDDYTDERYMMVTNALADMNGTPADCRQSIVLDFNNNAVTQVLQVLDPATGAVSDLNGTLISGKRRYTLTLDGGSALILKFKDGAPFVGFTPSDSIWTSSTTGTYSDANKWDTAPATDRFIHFGSTASGSGPTYTVNLGGTTSVKGMFVHRDNVTMNLGGFTFTQSGFAGIDSLIVGMYSGESGSLTVTNGTLVTSANATNFSQIGKASGATGTMTLGSGATWNNSTTLLVGKAGTGTFSNNGGTANLTSVYLGGSATASGGTGTMNVTSGTANITGALKLWNAASQINLSGGTLNVGSIDTTSNPTRFNWTGGTFGVTNSTLTIGSAGPIGTSLTISGTKNLNVTSTLAIASGGSINESAGSINAGTIQLPTGATLTRSGGTLDFTTFTHNGGTFTHSAASTDLRIAASGGANYNLSSGNLNVTAGIRLGMINYGNGTVTQTGGAATAANIYLGFEPFTTGTWTLSGAGTASATNIYVGGIASVAGGTGILNVSAGTMTATNTLKVWNNGAAAPGGTRVNLFAGTLNVGSLDTSGNPARFNWIGGTLGITNSTLNIGSAGPLGALFTITAPLTLNVTNTLAINSDGSFGQIGGVINAGTITLPAGGMFTRSGGTLSFTTFTHTGGTFSNNSGTDVIIAAASGANYNQSGGNITGAGNFRIGTTAGAGTLTQSGGFISAASIMLGYDSASTGTFTSNGTGNAIVTNIYVGGTSSAAAGTGVLNVSSGSVNATNTLKLWNSGAAAPNGSRVNLSGGTLIANALDTSGNPARFNWTGGTLNVVGGLAISAAGPLGSSLALSSGKTLITSSTSTIAAGSSLTQSGGTLQVASLNNSGTFTHTSGPLTISGTFTNSGVATFAADAAAAINATAGSVTFNASQHLPSLSASGPAVVSLPPNGNRVIVTNTVAASGKIDLTDNDMIVKSTSFSVVESLVKSGFGNFDWLGTGITSSTAASFAQVDGSRALGVIDNADWGYGMFSGETVTSTDVLVKFTWVSDANLDGLVDNDDFGQFLYGFNGGGSATWLNGDFDYSGVVDNDDFGWFLTGLGAFNASGNVQLSDSFKSELSSFATSNGIPLDFDELGRVVLPEPFTLAPFAACGLLLRRRQK